MFSGFLLVHQPALAGSLDKMKEDLNRKPAKSKNVDRKRHYQQCEQTADDCEDEAFGAFVAAVTTNLIILGYEKSLDRASSSTTAWDDMRYRQNGDALLPVLSLDVLHSRFNHNVSGWDLRGEMGYGPLALTSGYVLLNESDPTDQLSIFNVDAKLRLSAGNYVEIDLAVGLGRVEQDHGFHLALPLKIHPSRSWRIEVTPSWIFASGNVLSNYRALLLFGWSHVFIQAGVDIYQTETVTLIGPTVGLSFRY